MTLKNAAAIGGVAISAAALLCLFSGPVFSWIGGILSGSHSAETRSGYLGVFDASVVNRQLDQGNRVVVVACGELSPMRGSIICKSMPHDVFLKAVWTDYSLKWNSEENDSLFDPIAGVKDCAFVLLERGRHPVYYYLHSDLIDVLRQKR